mgnify:CR=1 FL=1
MTRPDPNALAQKLARSPFRARFQLGARENAMIDRHGQKRIAGHAGDFIRNRLAPAEPYRDGHQTPMRGHPVFIAQHATATCCRGCLASWHGIPAGRALDIEQQRYIRDVLMNWILQQHTPQPAADITADPQRPLF